MARTITSANSQFILILDGLFPIPQIIQGYASDDAFTLDPYDMGENYMGVDGVLSGGYTPNPKKQHIMLQADSASLDVFDIWRGAIESSRDVIIAQATIVLPSIGKAYALNRGFLKTAQALPSAKKVLQPVPYVIEWQDVQSSLV